jgi:hypothetical protein
MNEREQQLLSALIILESGDDGGGEPDPIEDLPKAVKDAMTEEEKDAKKAEARAAKDEGDEEIVKRAEKLTQILKAYVEGKISDNGDGVF